MLAALVGFGPQMRRQIGVRWLRIPLTATGSEGLIKKKLSLYVCVCVLLLLFIDSCRFRFVGNLWRFLRRGLLKSRSSSSRKWKRLNIERNWV